MTLYQLCVDSDLELVMNEFMVWLMEHKMSDVSKESSKYIEQKQFAYSMASSGVRTLQIEEQMFLIMLFIRNNLPGTEFGEQWFTNPEEQVKKAFQTIKAIRFK